MFQSKLTKGLALIIVSWIITRVAVSYAHPAPGMSPQEIWRVMSMGLRAVVVAAFIMLGYGVGILIEAVRSRFGKG